MIEDEYIEVDWIVMGVDRGKRRVHRNSIVGRLLLGDFAGAVSKTTHMVDELNELDKEQSARESGMTNPWTKRQLQAAMRAAGWERVPVPGSAYRHERTGRIIELDNTAGIINGVATRTWELYARRRKVPEAEIVR